MGPLISRQAVEKVRGLVDDAVSHGAVLVKEWSELIPSADDFPLLSKGHFTPPVMLDCRGMTSGSPLHHEEIFGPIIAMYRFSTEEELLKSANEVDAGLAAYVYVSDLKTSVRMSEALQYGMVGINAAIISHPEAPFGGIKQSGVGREGSKYGLSEYQNIKYICLGGLD